MFSIFSGEKMLGHFFKWEISMYFINKKCTQPWQFLEFSVFVVAKEVIIELVIKFETVLEIVVVIFVELSLFVLTLLELEVCVVLT